MLQIHPGEDLHDGATFEMFLERVDNHPRCNLLLDPSHFVLQQLDYLAYIDIYHDRIKMFHVKDAEFNPTGRVGMYGGFQSWVDRAGRFRSLGDGQVDFQRIFSKLTQYEFDGWAVPEWECCIKSAEQGAAEGETVKRTGMIFRLTYTYTGYPMVRQAREMVAAGELGKLGVVQVEYAQDWVTTPLERTGQKQAEWRTDPARNGPAGCLGDIGTQAHNLAAFVTGLHCQELAADLSIFVPGPEGGRQRPCPAAVLRGRAGHAVGDPGCARQRE